MRTGPFVLGIGIELSADSFREQRRGGIGRALPPPGARSRLVMGKRQLSEKSS